MEPHRFEQEVAVKFGRPSAFPVPPELFDRLRALLGRHSEIRRAFLIEIHYPPGFEPSVGDAPHLTCVLDLADESAFERISAASGSVLDGAFGPWRYLDFMPFSGAIGPAAAEAVPPFFP